MPADESLSNEVDAAHGPAAEAVREALVRLRGGAPFLSGQDGALLVRWLDEGLRVATILAALETAAARRRARRVRAPLELRHAKTHLAAAPRVPSAAAPTRLGPLPVAVDLTGLPEAAQPAADALRARLAALPEDGADAADRAASAVVAFFDDAWRALGGPGRARYLQAAAATFGDALDDLDDARRDAIVEEHARALLRAQVPGITIVAVLRELSRA